MAIIPLQMKLGYRIGMHYGHELDRGAGAASAVDPAAQPDHQRARTSPAGHAELDRTIEDGDVRTRL
jgi:hypothetical protein